MAKYTGKSALIQHPASEVWDKVSNLGAFQQYLDKLPEDIRAKAGDVRFTEDSMIINAPGAGEITLQRTEVDPGHSMTLTALGAPVDMKVVLTVESRDDGEDSEVIPVIDVDVPMFARAFVAPKLQAAADQLGTMLQNLLNI